MAKKDLLEAGYLLSCGTTIGRCCPSGWFASSLSLVVCVVATSVVHVEDDALLRAANVPCVMWLPISSCIFPAGASETLKTRIDSPAPTPIHAPTPRVWIARPYPRLRETLRKKELQRFTRLCL